MRRVLEIAWFTLMAILGSIITGSLTWIAFENNSKAAPLGVIAILVFLFALVVLYKETFSSSRKEKKGGA